VVPVLMTSCQVSDQPKSGPETVQSRTTAIASTKVDERPTCRSTQRANRAKSGVALVSASKVGSEDPSSINQPSIFPRPLQRGSIEYCSNSEAYSMDCSTQARVGRRSFQTRSGREVAGIGDRCGGHAAAAPRGAADPCGRQLQVRPEIDPSFRTTR
jgi:hypothetical protein